MCCSWARQAVSFLQGKPQRFAASCCDVGTGSAAARLPLALLTARLTAADRTAVCPPPVPPPLLGQGGLAARLSIWRAVTASLLPLPPTRTAGRCRRPTRRPSAWTSWMATEALQAAVPASPASPAPAAAHRTVPAAAGRALKQQHAEGDRKLCVLHAFLYMVRLAPN